MKKNKRNCKEGNIANRKKKKELQNEGKCKIISRKSKGRKQLKTENLQKKKETKNNERSNII